MPKVSVCIPVYNMDNGEVLLKRNLDSIMKQNFKDFEIVVSDGAKGKFNELLGNYPVRMVMGKPGMANNTNNAIDNARGEIVKILFQDDFFYNQSALRQIVKHLTPTFNWLACGCYHTLDGKSLINPHKPFFSWSANTIGSPSVVAFKNSVSIRFDPQFKWVLDLDFYRRLQETYGSPKILNQYEVVIGLHSGQETNKLPLEIKIKEQQLMTIK